ncbi:bifunctional RNase H/acid phosphatase [Streptomyces caniscabiei]|uniref:Bifunctional RNase H/acid phosphatase n=1 Tax=Streptomyces caniscabiei TaxID=2746961 RepID=A0ABU4MR80_9ACTN|nr:bifunctional RNase H/acid phosphatase [Streptomyces caniscabiei]MBE4769179.1 bifunctional RNase H/acid phosphatase [Streptomyces caniscabiei]MBE4785099.1 bifunctional RNase H/acid phosphatase [Streptomyces caniscabiei]MBE4795884.1 bifunctional RNase H/acid phosphatase [Streptomyces caniscabiei]MDX2945721.1 bifunctional RNase H/acid phosphatase [Streptomyces caniscabiei]MDX2949637.1 bifunctional RNase H/acid phosphatase [Streptomyces caniscabiei]
MREFIVEADGGSRGNPGPAGYGSVVLDAVTGETLVEAAEYIGIATNNVAEYRGLIAGLKAARELDPEASVRVRMDSKLVVEQMSGRWKIKHPDMKPLAAEAARVLPPGRVTYEWMPREQNKHADRLANEAMDAGKRGEQWSAATSTADLDTSAARAAAAIAAAAPEPSGPPGDATAGAAKVRAALAGTSQAGTSRVGASQAGAHTAADDKTAETVADLTAKAAADPAAKAAADLTAKAAADLAAKTAADLAAKTAADLAAKTAADLAAKTAADPAAKTAADPAAEAVTDPAAKAPADLRAARNVASVASAAPDLGTPATFVLLRHGETPLTPQKRFSGSGGSDPSLSDVGRYQAERVAAALAARGTIQEVVSSPLARCRETAGIVAARLGLKVAVEDGLRETDFGAWEGLSFGEVRERYPDDMNAWLASPDAEPTGGGESFAAVAHRVAATRDELVAAYRGRTVLLVSHVTPIKTLVRLALGAPPESLFRMELSAASLSALAYYADGNATLRLLNDTSHLR